ncbi:ATP-binding cassette sub-family G member 5 [Ixodes scapularis]|uniref:ATP-binding cassette sub-family G member 5 n=1 Tax=Ixodes scapularis TaxID=6945 RepID=UPI001161580C|nr:ATP-binding cassette sub-family G member 5 [Ixodes scapularis]
MATDHVLELSGVHYTGPVAPPTCFQAFTGTGVTAPLLKDVSLELHAGEVMAVLGSKGSGKKALLEVVARRAMGPTRGQILLNDVPLTVRLFQEQCGYVARRVTLVPGVTVRQTLHFAAKLTVASKVSGSVKRGRVKQVMADLALNQVSNKEVSTLSVNEYRRLSIAMELVRDPVLIVLDEPTADLDPLNTYFVVSILANHAKKYNRLVLLTMSKPRSDIFPFLDRVAYLCLGELVYTGHTRTMLEYFRSIGFPCPELENPLMYYLCLATVDRRSRERFIDSSSQIQTLVEKFRTDGSRYRKGGPPSEMGNMTESSQYKLPLTAYGQPSCWHTFWALYGRLWASSFNCNGRAMGHLGLRVALMPVLFALLLLFYFPLSGFQHSFLSRNGLFLSCFVASSFGAAAITAVTYAPHRTRYYQESREGKYRGPLFVFSHTVFSMPLSVISVFAGATIIYAGTGLRMDWQRWATFCGVLWCLYALAEQQTVALMMVVKSSYAAFRASACILSICIALASGTVRSLVVLPDWTYYLTYATLQRYAAAFVQQNELDMHPGLENLPSFNGTLCGPNVESGRCFFVNGTHYLGHKFRMGGRGQSGVDVLYWLNFGICFAFVGSFCLVNVISHIIPLPASIKSKFRD